MRSPNEPMPTGALYSAYALGVSALSPLVAAAFLVSPRGRRRYGERLGAWGQVGGVDWWFHGASVGEVQGLLPLTRALKQARPTESTLLTSTSPTGLDRGADGFTHTRILPFDAPWAVRRALSSVNPQRFVLAETELWPTLLVELARRGVPCAIVNGRVSDYTFDRYKRARRLFAPLLQNFEHVCVASVEQGERFQQLGCPMERVIVTGHTKYDCEPVVKSAAARDALQREFIQESARSLPTVVLGSLRPGEEGYWFKACAEARQSGARFNLIVAPRHMEKVSFFQDAAASYGIPVSLLSAGGQADGCSGSALIIDRMGRLEEVYSISQLAFVGATLVDIGGHNPLEPAMYGVPVVVGPHVSVIREIVGEMREACGILEVSDSAQIQGVLARLVGQAGGLAEIGAKGESVWQRHRGASSRVLTRLLHE